MNDFDNVVEVGMEPMVPVHYRNAILDIFNIPMSEERQFIALTWTHRPLNASSPMPTPLCWLVSAENLDAATVCSQVIRNILDGMLMEQLRGEITPPEFEAIRLMVIKRVKLLSIREAHNILDDLGIPVYNNSSFHKVEDIVMVPFDEDCGFSEHNVITYIGQIPNYVARIVE